MKYRSPFIQGLVLGLLSPLIIVRPQIIERPPRIKRQLKPIYRPPSEDIENMRQDFAKAVNYVESDIKRSQNK